MCHMHQELVLEVKDLEIIEIVCGSCASCIGIDLNSDVFNYPDRCPNCRADLNDTNLKGGLIGYKSAYKALRQVTAHKFRIRLVLSRTSL